MSSETGLARVMSERSRRGRCSAQAFLGLVEVQKVGKLMKSRKSSLSCLGFPDRFEKHQVVLTGQYLYWADRDVSGLKEHVWVSQGGIQDWFAGHVNLAIPDCQIAPVEGNNTCFMIQEGCVHAGEGKAPIIFDAGSQECRDEWMKQVAAKVERYASAYRNLSGEVATCAICFETGTKGLCRTRCGHDFHKTCLAQWLEAHRSCPCCRQVLI